MMAVVDLQQRKPTCALKHQTSFSLLGKRGLRRAAASWSRRRDQLLRHEAIGTLRLGRPGYQAGLSELLLDGSTAMRP